MKIRKEAREQGPHGQGGTWAGVPTLTIPPLLGMDGDLGVGAACVVHSLLVE